MACTSSAAAAADVFCDANTVCTIVTHHHHHHRQDIYHCFQVLANSRNGTLGEGLIALHALVIIRIQQAGPLPVLRCRARAVDWVMQADTRRHAL